MTGAVHVSIFGNFQVTFPDGRVAAFRTRRAAELVAQLCLAPRGRRLRTEVAAELWPDAERTIRLNNLRPALNYARTGLEASDLITAVEDWLELADEVEHDAKELRRLEAKVQHTSSAEDRLVLLYSIHNLVQKPLLAGWEAEWLEPHQRAHEQRRLTSLRQLSEELASRGEWQPALDFALQMSELDALSEDAIRLQVTYLGELKRPDAAQQLFNRYAKQLHQTLGLKVNSSVRRLAEEVSAGNYRASGAKPMTAVQHEMIYEVMQMLADEEPERLLPLLSTPKLNWSIVLHGSELRPIFERALSATEGWSADRAGVAKRLLQVYAQEEDWSRLIPLASDLLTSPDVRDQIAALNYLAFDELRNQDYPQALALYDRAESLAKTVDDRYLIAVSVTNRAILNIHFQMHRLGLQELLAVQSELAERREPNARFSTSMAKGWIIAAYLGDGNVVEAERAAQEWRLFAEVNGTMPYDFNGKLLYGATLANAKERSAPDWLLSGIDAAFQTRQRSVIHESCCVSVYGMRALGKEREARSAAAGLLQFSKSNLSPFQRHLLGRSESDHVLPFESAADVLGYCREKLLSTR